MANKEHLAIFKRGVATWNQWRKEHPEIRPDLSDATLIRANLSTADLGHANLSGAKLTLATLINAILTDANLSGSILYEATLSGADLSGANLTDANLSYAKLNHATLTRADLSGANFGSANLTFANFINARLTDATLINATLINATLSGANFGSANLINATLNGATLNGTNLSDANLSGSILYEANLSGANLSDATLTNARIWGTIFGDIDLSTAKGLETVEHRGPSTIGIDTIYRSQGKIPEIFLRGAGVPDSVIEYMRSLVGKPIDYYSCFISYSSKDEQFARRLYNDLQGSGVRCWFAPEDMEIGDKIRPRIDESIRLYDKLLIVLSEHSLASNWVAYEVERALSKEPQGVPNVLYPVRLDDAVVKSRAGWANDVRSTRYIGDFTSWKNHDDYQRAFDRLLRALKAKSQQQGT